MGGGGVNQVAVSDTGPLIHLDQVNALSFLSVFSELLVPSTVYKELSAGNVPEGLDALDYEIREVQGDRFPELDAGEAAALVLSEEEEALFLTDDLEARKTAEEEGVEVHGSIGVIALAFHRNRIDQEEAARLMRELQERSDLFVTDAVVEHGIEKLEEREAN